jgi:hypothetical protein
MADEKKKPFEFEASYELYNARGERLRNVLFIENPGSGQTLQLDIVNVLVDETITLNTVETVSESKYHFRLNFGGGALANRVASVAGDDWAIKRVTNASGTDLYVAWRSPDVTLAPGDRLVMQLHGVSAGPEAGTKIPLKLTWPEPDTAPTSTAALVITPQGPGEGDYELAHDLPLGVRDRRGRPDIPLRAGFVGSNQVLNMDDEESSLTLRLVNSAPSDSNKKLLFRYVADQPELTSRLVVALPVGTAAEQPWALGTEDQVNGMVLELAGWKVVRPASNGDEGRLEWELTPTKDVTLAPQQFLDITLSKLKTAHPSGPANLELRHSAVPGYWDGEIVCPIEKAPLVFGRSERQDKVGIGESQPATRLHLRNGDLRLEGAEIQHKGPLVFRSDVDNTGDEGAVRIFGKDGSTPLMEVNSDGGFKITNGDKPLMELNANGGLKISNGDKPLMELNANGGLKINNGSSPLMELNANGGFKINNGSNPLMEVNSDGVVKLKGSKPFVWRRYRKERGNVAGYFWIDTTFSGADWVPVLQGFNIICDPANYHQFSIDVASREDNTWGILVDMGESRVHSASVSVVFIRRELVDYYD